MGGRYVELFRVSRAEMIQALEQLSPRWGAAHVAIEKVPPSGLQEMDARTAPAPRRAREAHAAT